MTATIASLGRKTGFSSSSLAVARDAISQRIAARIVADPSFRQDFQILMGLYDAEDAAAGRTPREVFSLSIQLPRPARPRPAPGTDVLGMDDPAGDNSSTSTGADAPATNTGIVGPGALLDTPDIRINPPWLGWPPRDFPPYDPPYDPWPWFGWPPRAPYPPRYPMPYPFPRPMPGPGPVIEPPRAYPR